MNVWLCCGCNHEILAKEDPLYCEWCGSQTLKDLGEDVTYKKWTAGKRKILKEMGVDDEGNDS